MGGQAGASFVAGITHLALPSSFIEGECPCEHPPLACHCHAFPSPPHVCATITQPFSHYYLPRRLLCAVTTDGGTNTITPVSGRRAGRVPMEETSLLPTKWSGA